MLNLRLLSDELAYGLLFYLMFCIYMKQARKTQIEKNARRKGIILLMLHSVCQFVLIFFVPDLYVPSLVRLAIVIPIGCIKLL